MSFTLLSLILSLLATAVMAASAAIQARRFGLDLFGATVLAIAAGMGGGTLRDLFIGRTPVFWVEDIRYILVAIPIAIATYALAVTMQEGTGKRHALLMHLDAIGLALFTLSGVQIAQSAGIGVIPSIILGCVTGTAGGMIRDVLCNVTPSVLKEDLYATLSLIGGGLFILLQQYVSEETALISSFVMILLARILVLQRGALKTLYDNE
ncbi:MAG: trimeric intracellular cation channel family protein [Halocynthiibacter sp.]